MIVLATLVGVIYFQLDDSYAGFQNRLQTICLSYYCTTFFIELVPSSLSLWILYLEIFLLWSYSYENDPYLCVFRYKVLILRDCYICMFKFYVVIKMLQDTTEFQLTFSQKSFATSCRWDFYQWLPSQQFLIGCWVSVISSQ